MRLTKRKGTCSPRAAAIEPIKPSRMPIVPPMLDGGFYD